MHWLEASERQGSLLDFSNVFSEFVIKDLGNEYAAVVTDGIAAGDTASFVDTGSYIFNALVSGSIYGGIPSNKVVFPCW